MLAWTKISLTDIRQGAQLLGAKASVFYLLKMYAGKTDKQIAFPSQSTLCKITGFSRGAITRALKTLQDENWIEHHGYHDSGQVRTAIWKICEPENRKGVSTIRDTPCLENETPPVYNKRHKKEKDRTKKNTNKDSLNNFSNNEPEIRIRVVPKL